MENDGVYWTVVTKEAMMENLQEFWLVGKTDYELAVVKDCYVVLK